MSTRTIRATVHFSASFTIAGLGAAQPPGDYEVDHDEEQIEGLSWLAYRRVATLMHLPAIGAVSATRQLIAIDPADLDAALVKDAQVGSARPAPHSNAAR